MSAVLHQAILRRNFHQVRLLTKMGCNVNRPDPRMRTPLRLVCDLSNERLRVALGRILLQHGARVDSKDEFGISVFSYACIQKRTQLVQIMIREREIHWLDTDDKGNTALHHAVASGNRVIARLVIEQMRKYGLDIDIRNAIGQTPLILAERLGHVACAQILRETGRASTAARDSHVFKNAEQWRCTWTEKTSRKLSPHFSAKFPDVADQLTETVYIKIPALLKREREFAQNNNRRNKHHIYRGGSVKTDALPTLLKLYKEQLLDSYRCSAKFVRIETCQTSDKRRDSKPEDESLRPVPVKRKSFSYAGLTTQQTLLNMSGKLMHVDQNTRAKKEEGDFVQLRTSTENTGFPKEAKQASASKKHLRRRNTVDLTAFNRNVMARVPRGRAETFETVSEETVDA